MPSDRSGEVEAQAPSAPERPGLLQRLEDGLYKQVDPASLAFFRIGFGLIMLVECWRFWEHGWIDRYYIDPEFYFKYYGFEWVAPWPGDGMYWHFGLLAVLSLMIMLGLFYRAAMIVFFFAFTYVFLLDQARYLNHFVLVSMIAFLMMLVPANRIWSLDAVIARRLRDRPPEVPAWTVWLFVLQFEIMYIYAGIVKIYPDWLRLEPLAMWLARRADAPLIGPLFLEDWVIATGAYGVILLHIVGAPLLLFKRTRLPVTVVYFAFHLANHFIFTIGIFPWVAMLGTLMFFDPDWPRRLAERLRTALGRLVSSERRVADV